MKMQFKLFLSKILLILTAVFAMQNVMAAEEGPNELTKKASEKLFADLKANSSKIQADPNVLRTLVRQDLMPYAHVNYAGSLVLGQYFKSTTPEQREKFFAAFDKFIEWAYADALKMYKGQDIQVGAAQFASDNQASVNVKIMQDRPLSLTFQWRKNSKTGQWLVYDMTVAGASMVETKKKEWSGLLHREGIEALTAQVLKAAAAPITLSK